MNKSITTLGIVLGLFSTSSRADLFEPFSSSNLHPFVQAAGLPTNRSADPGTGLGLRTEIANNFTQSIDGAEAVVLDGETLRATLTANWQVAEQWNLGLEIPYVRHSGGHLDQFIESWHSVFGLPNAGRENAMQNQLQYGYLGPTERVNRVQSTSGPGDIQLSLGYHWASKKLSEKSRRIAVRGGVSVPTGDASKLTGSNTTRFFLSTHLSEDAIFNRDSLSFHGSLGLLHVGDSEVLSSIAEDIVVFGSGTLVWHTWERVALKTQLDFHSAAFDSDVRELGTVSAQLLVGGSLQLGPKTWLDIAVSEDIVTDTAPDVAFLFELKQAF